MLSPDQRSEIEQLIFAQIDELEASIQHMLERLAPVEPDVAIGRLSRMDSLVNKGTLEMSVAESQKRLNRLRDKLTRVHDADFGQCGMCGEMISLERLRAAPDRGVCVSCLQKNQKRR